MGFSDRQIRALHRNVAARNIRARVSDGKEFSYIEGWFAIAEANRIFGFDGWDRETIEAKCIQAREVRGSHSVLYTVRVRITVRTIDGATIRDGFGTGEGHGPRLSEAHDLALKAAETRCHQAGAGHLRQGLWPGSLRRWPAEVCSRWHSLSLIVTEDCFATRNAR